MQVQPVLDPFAGIGEQAFEDPAHGEDGGARIHAEAGGLHLAHLAADGRRAFQHGDLGAPPREVHGGGQPAHAGADDHDPPRAWRLAWAASLRAVHPQRQAACATAPRRCRAARSMASRCQMMITSPIASGTAHISGCSANSGRMRTEPKAMKAV